MENPVLFSPSLAHKLELFLANSDLSPEQRKEVEDMLKSAHTEGYVKRTLEELTKNIHK